VTSPKYCLDAGVFINSWIKHYPIDVFPSVWECLDELLKSGIAFVPREVYEEVERGGDDVHEWLSKRRSAVVEPDEPVILLVKQIMKDHGRLCHGKPGRSGADPFVIAHAKVVGASVVTEESISKKPIDPKIPDVCNALGIPVMNTVSLLRECKLSL
jgi:hypothetical protein